MDKTTTLPTVNLSDTRMDEFWDNLDPGLTQPKPAPRNLDVGLSDLARATGAGGLELVGGIGELARQAANYGRTHGGKEQGDYLENARANMAAKLAPVLDVVGGLGDLAQSGADSLKSGMSADAQEAMSHSLVAETPQGRLELGDGAGDIDVWAMKMAQGVGSLLPTLLSGGVTGVAARATVGRMVTSSMLKKGVSQEVAEAVAAKTVARLATGAATATGITGSVGAAGVNARDSVLGMSFDALSNSTTFRDAFRRIDGDQQLAHLSDSDKLAMAREETANLASQATMGDAKTWGAAAVGTLMGDTMLFKMLAGKGAGAGVLKGMARGAAGEGISEALEEGTQQYSVNEALNEVAGANIDPMKGVVSSAVEGGLIGAGVGGATGGVSGLRGERAQPQSGEQDQPVTQEQDLAGQVEPVAADEIITETQQQESPLGPSASQFDELRDVPAYLRQDGTAERFKGFAEDSEVQRALAGEFGQSVQELVAAQMQGGEQGKSFYERVQAGELGADPFAGDKSALQVAAESQRLQLPLKDVIFAGDASARPKGDEVAAPGDLDDRQPDRSLGEQSTRDPRSPVARAIEQAGGEHDSIFGPLKSLRITRKGKPFATEKEAALASRKGQETPVPLNGGGFGVAAIEEVEQAKGVMADNSEEQSHEQIAGVDPVGSKGEGDQQPAGAPVSAVAGAEPDTADALPAPAREHSPAPDAARDESLPDDDALTPAPAGVAVSGAHADQGNNASAWSGKKSADEYREAQQRLFSGEMDFAEFQAMSRSALDNAPSLRAELEKKTKQDLLDQMSRFNAARYKNDKKAVAVEAAYNQLIGDLRWAANGDSNTMSETYAIGAARQSIEERVAKALDGLTPERYQQFRDKQLADMAESQRRREALKQALTDPQSLEDFQAFIERRGLDKLTTEQRARYEDMIAARNLDRRDQSREAKAEARVVPTASGDIIKATHTKSGADLFVVQMGDRVERDAYNRINAYAKTLGGWYSSFRGKGAVPGFQFKEEAKAAEFRAWLGGQGESAPHQAVAADPTEVVEAQPVEGKVKQIEALRSRAASARAKAEAVLNTERKENTARRAGMAANARANAERDLRFAGLLEAIATGIEGGEITYLRNLANGAQLEELQTALNRGLWSLSAARHDALVSEGVITRDDSGRYSWSDKATPEQMVEGVSMPGMDYYTDRLREVAIKMQGASGYKQAGAKIMSLVKAATNRDSKTTTLSDPELIAKLKAYVSGGEDYSTSTIKDQIAGYGRLERMGITNHTELRAALRELVRLQRGLNEKVTQRDPVAEKTRALKLRLLNNRNAFIDFFPTTEDHSADLAARLGIEPGMLVLEPSAGHGMLAEAAREAGATVEAVELAADLREILAAKGFSLVGDDFMATQPTQRYDAVIMNPPFSNDMDIDHVRHAFEHLKPGGRLAAIVSSMAGRRSNKKNQAFREWLDSLGASEEMMPEGAFKDSLNPTNVRTKILLIEKPALTVAAPAVEGVHFSKQSQAKGDVRPTRPLTRKEAEMVTNGWLKQYRGVDGINIQIHATQAEMERALGLSPVDGLIRRAAFDRTVDAMHVAADTIANPKHLREILRHEVLAHYGLAKVLGGVHYTRLLSRVMGSRNDATMKEVWEWVQTNYADEPIMVQAEEVIAHLAELEPSAWRRGWDRVVSWVTRALRAVGFVSDGVTAAEIRSMIEAMGKQLEKGRGSASSELGSLRFSAERTPWKPGFPEVILHGRLGDATAHPDYEAAKGGDDAAARRLVSDVLTKDAVRRLKELIGDREAIALGVHAEEAVSRNAIPRAMADVLATVLDMDVDLDIVQAAKVGRTAQDGFGRLANQPNFDGPVRTDKPYLIMDDTLTQGGTLANLKGYIEARGGEVLAATALTGKQYSAKIAIDSSTLEQLRDQYDGTGLEAWWQNQFSYGFDSLTESEARYLLRAKDADKIRDRVAAAGQSSPARSEHESARDDGSLPPDGLKFSQSFGADDALQKLNLGRKPDIIDRAHERLDALRGTDRATIKGWVDRFIQKANTEVLDALAPIKYAEDAAGVTDAGESGYVAARMASGAASTMQATMLYGLPEWKDGVIQRKAGTGEADALLGIFEGLGKDLHNWLGWMAGHRAELLMEQGRENLLTAQDIAALKALDKGKEAEFLDAKRRWNALNAATLDLAQEAGLFTAEERAKWESEWYIPFFREGEGGDALAPFKAKGVANQSAGIKKLKGGTAHTADLLENIFTSTSKLIDASMKNMAAQKTVWNLADTGIIEVVAKPNMMDWRALQKGRELITVKLEGEDYLIRVNDPELYRAMTFFDRQPHGKLVQIAAGAKRLLTAGVTASPEFMLRNFLRDSLSSWAISKDGFKPVIDSIKGVKKTLTMDGSTIDVMFSGASFLGGYVNGNDPKAMADSVRKALRRKGMTPEQIERYERSLIRNAKQAREVLGKAWDQYSKYGEAFENANREAVYEAAINNGKSHAQAAFEAKDLMDFSMLGASRVMQTLVMVLPFFNARVQGLGKLARELRDNPRAIAKRAGMITAASLALLAMNWDDERYEELPDWDKDANWHMWLGDQHFRIPKPFEIGVMFGTIPERMVRAMGDKDSGAQFGKAVARAVGETFALNPIPQIVKPMSEAYFNYDPFRGGPIENFADQSVMPEARYSEQTSLLMRELGQLTGMSPKKLEHLVVGYTGTLGGYVLSAADSLIRASRPGESAALRADEIPLIKAVYRGSGPAKSTQHMEQFYRMLSEVNELKRTVDQYRKEGMGEEAKALLDEQGGILKARRSLSQTQTQVRQLRNRLELIQRDQTLSSDEKRSRIDAILAKRNDLVYRVVERTKRLWQ